MAGIGEQTSDVIGCPNCGQLLRVPSIRKRGTATCQSCFANFTVEGTVPDARTEPSMHQQSDSNVQPQKTEETWGVQLAKFIAAIAGIGLFLAKVGPSLVGGAVVLVLIAPCLGPVIVAAIGGALVYGLMWFWHWIQE